MPNLIDLTGKMFGRWTVLREDGRKQMGGHNDRKVMWLCHCECGIERSVQAGNLLSGLTKSCGCLNLELCKSRATTHGMSDTREFKNWLLMIDRCTNKNNKRWNRYGGRGIKVCARWLDFSLFYADMGNKPKGLTIERINNDGNYEPGNCRWATPTEQQRNKRSNRILEAFGRKQILAEWERELGMSASLLHYHLRSGIKTLEQIITERS